MSWKGTPGNSIVKFITKQKSDLESIKLLLNKLIFVRPTVYENTQTGTKRFLPAFPKHRWFKEFRFVMSVRLSRVRIREEILEDATETKRFQDDMSCS